MHDVYELQAANTLAAATPKSDGNHMDVSVNVYYEIYLKCSSFSLALALAGPGMLGSSHEIKHSHMNSLIWITRRAN